MSQDKLILNLVGLKDPHIHFEADAKTQTGLYHGHPALFINAKLLKKISQCPNCGFADCL